MKYVSVLLILVGIACFVLFAVLGHTVEANGHLREPFALLPLGWLFIVLGAGCLVASLIRQARRKPVTRTINKG